MYMYFRYFVIISPWKRAWPFIWTNMNSHHPRMLCAKFGWNWHSCSEEEDFEFHQCTGYICFFVIISLWKKVRPFIGTNLHPLYPRMVCAKFGWNWGGLIIHHAFDIEKKYTDIISLEVIDQFKQSNYKTRGPWATLFTWAEVSINK